jgi:hypothetical protein
MAVIGAALGVLAAIRAPGWVPAAVLVPIAAVLTSTIVNRPWTAARSTSAGRTVISLGQQLGGGDRRVGAPGRS